jgi:hypothetical protein
LLRRWSAAPFRSETSAQRHYELIPPRFFVEELLDDPLAPPGQALCYMVRCIHGFPVTLSIILGSRQCSFTVDGRRIAAGGAAERSEGGRRAGAIRSEGGRRRGSLAADPIGAPPPRALFVALLTTAARLAQPFEFVRVDFHVPGRAEGGRDASASLGVPSGASALLGVPSDASALLGVPSGDGAAKEPAAELRRKDQGPPSGAKVNRSEGVPPCPALYFSEFTFTPAAGAKVFCDAEERRQGALWI